MKKILIHIPILLIIGTLLLFLALSVAGRQKAHACSGWFCRDSADVNSTENSALKESKITEVNQRRLLQNQPVPQLNSSEERKNLIERLKRFNNENKISYIYLINFGKVMAFYTIKGKVSSVNSFLTTTKQIVDKAGEQCHYRSGDCYVIDSPDIDGSYGSNGNAIFFFTTDNVYVEWQGDYMLVDQPLQLITQPELIRQVK